MIHSFEFTANWSFAIDLQIKDESNYIILALSGLNVDHVPTNFSFSNSGNSVPIQHSDSVLQREIEKGLQDAIGKIRNTLPGILKDAGTSVFFGIDRTTKGARHDSQRGIT